MHTSLKLSSVKTEDVGELLVRSSYRVESCPDKSPVTFWQDLEIVQRPDGSAVARMSFTDMEPQPDVEAAMDKLATWLENMAIAIRSRKAERTITLYK